MRSFCDRKSIMARPSISPEERQLRTTQLLDAAVALLLENPDRIPSVAEVAARAGIAKGAVYLYFRRKEDLLLAAHERHIAMFFDALVEYAQADAPVTFAGVFELATLHLIQPQVVLPLAALIGGVLHKKAHPEAVDAFEQRLAERLRLAGSLLYRHFPLPDELSGVRLLMRSFALILGLWQLIGREKPMCGSPEISAMLLPDYPSELHAALYALWQGAYDKDDNHA